MRFHWSIVLCMAALLTCSLAAAQQTCDYTAVGKTMESAAAQGDWAAAYQHAQEIVDDRPDDVATLSADEKYWLGLAHMYLMAQSFDMAAGQLEGDRAQTAADMAATVLNPGVENVRKISHGEEVELTDYLVEGKTVLFDFFSKYCPPCMQIAPALEQLANQRDDIVLVKVDINRPGVEGIDWQSPVARQYKLNSIPHFRIYGPDGALQAEGGAARNQVVNWLGEMEG